MEKTTKTGMHLAWELKEGVWMKPEDAARYFKNGKGITLNHLMFALRSGKFQDIAYRDAFGWHVFIPQHLIDRKEFNNDQQAKSFSAA